jgi:predicted O-methyltransferase YrrM
MSKIIHCGYGRVGLAAIFAFLEYKAGAEIGVAGGNYSHVIAKNNRGAKLYSVDHWKNNEANYQKAAAKLSTMGNVDIIRKTSAEAVKMFEDGALDFVYIDAAHDYDNVSFDIAALAQKIRSGGIVSGHDYSNQEPGVIKAVNEYADANGIDKVYILACNSWYWMKQ